MAEHRTVNGKEDPVCGMTVDPGEARSKGVITTYEGTDYVFCGKGCFLEFREDPETFLASAYTPTM